MNKTKIDFNPKNDNLLLKKIEIEQMIGGIILADPDKWQKRGEVIKVSPKLSPFVDDFYEGDIVIYPINTPELNIRIDDQSYLIIRKIDVVTTI